MNYSVLPPGQALDSLTEFIVECVLDVLGRCRAEPPRIAFGDFGDARVRAAARMVGQRGVAQPLAVEAGRTRSPRLGPQERVVEVAEMVACGDADGAVLGAQTASGDVLRGAMSVLGLSTGRTRITGGALLQTGDARRFMLVDPIVLVAPNAQELKEAYQAACVLWRLLFRTEPMGAFVSSSTHGTGIDTYSDLIRETIGLLSPNERQSVDGPVQLDVALDPRVAGMKGVSRIQGEADIIVLPMLAAANPVLKMFEFAHGHASCTFLSGTRRPFQDVSRGCSVAQLVASTGIAVLQHVSDLES